MTTLQEIISVQNLALSNNPKGTDKGDYKSYVDGFYQKYFSKRKNDSIALLEIGYRHGASLALWSSFFTNGQITGLDNGSDKMTQGNGPVAEWVNRPNVKALVADAYAPECAANINQTFDIIIDDGPHSIESQRQAIRLYLNKLRLNGLFIIEDIQKIGGLCLFAFLPIIPLRYHVQLFDFRANRKGNDDLLLVISNNHKLNILNRLGQWLKAFIYLVKEPLQLVKSKLA